MAEDTAVKEQDAQAEEEPKAEETPTETENQEEAPKQPAHNFDKGLSNVQRDLRASRREMAELKQMFQDSLNAKAEPAVQAKVEAAVDGFLKDRETDDVLNVSDAQNLLKEIKALGRGSGLDAAAVEGIVSKALGPLLESKSKADEMQFWVDTERDTGIPIVDARRIWEEAADKGAEQFQSKDGRYSATKTHFDYAIAAEQRRRKRATSPSTESPTSSKGTQTVKNGADATTGSVKDKPTMDELYRALDPNGQL